MDVAETVRQAVDIVTIINEAVPIKKRGRDYLGLCPFHSEKTPSFSVSPQKQLFYCFGCHAGGNVFSFVQKFYNWDFPQALEELARRAGIKIESFKSDPLWEEGLVINEVVGEFFRESLCGKDGEEGRAYLKSRKIPQKMVESFDLGFHPGGPSLVVKLLQKKGHSLDRAAQLGLIGRLPSGDWMDRLRGRLMFPIKDEKGRIRGFGGRSLGSEQPKYINSPKSSLFDKSRLFYGMHLANPAIAKRGFAVLVEGYLDVMALHEFGVTNTLGTMGTALTFDQIRLLKRHTSKVISLFDLDRAGLAATEKNLGNFLREGIEAKVVALPSGKDPDAFLHSGEKAEVLKGQLKKAFEDSILAVDHLIKHTVLTEKTPFQRAKRVRDLIRILDEIPDEIERTLIKKDIAKRFELEESLLIRSDERSMEAPSLPKPAHKATSKGPTTQDEVFEREVLKFLVKNGEKGVFALTELLPFLSSASRWSKVLEKMAEIELSSSAIAGLGWLEAAEPVFQDKALHQTVHEWVFEPAGELNAEGIQNLWLDLCRGLRKAHYRRTSQKIQEEILKAKAAGDSQRLDQLLAEKSDLARVIQAVT